MNDQDSDIGRPAKEESDPLQDLAERMGRLEDLLTRKPKAEKAFHERYGWLLGMFSTLLIFFLGYFLKDTVDLGLKERQLELASSREVQQLVQKLAAPEITAEQRNTAAVALAEYGDIAIAPLVRHLRVRTRESGQAAAEGLRVSALVKRAETCATLALVLDDWRRDFPIWAHERAARLLGELRCKDQLDALERYAALVPSSVEAIEPYLQHVQPGARVLDSDVDKVRQAVEGALGSLRGAP